MLDIVGGVSIENIAASAADFDTGYNTLSVGEKVVLIDIQPETVTIGNNSRVATYKNKKRRISELEVTFIICVSI